MGTVEEQSDWLFDNDTDTARMSGSSVLLLEWESVKYTTLPLSSVDFIGSWLASLDKTGGKFIRVTNINQKLEAAKSQLSTNKWSDQVVILQESEGKGPLLFVKYGHISGNKLHRLA